MHFVDFDPLVREIVAKSDTIGVIATNMTRWDRFEDDFRVIDDSLDFPIFGVGVATRADRCWINT